MNRLYLALIVLCFCGTSTAGAYSAYGSVAPFIIIPVWILAACLLFASGLDMLVAALATGTGARGAIIVTVAVLIACVIFLANSSEKRSRERRARTYVSTGSEK